MIGLSLSDDMLENVRECDTARAMCETILNVFERHTLLNKLRARREFYTVTMKPGEKVLPYMNRIRQLWATLKSMGVDVDEEEMAMAALNGLPGRYEYIITALDAVSDGESRFTYDLVKSRLLQEEQRAHMRTEADHVDGSALFNRTADVARRNVPRCGHCQRIGHTEARCWDLYPERRPAHYSGRPNRGTNGKS